MKNISVKKYNTICEKSNGKCYYCGFDFKEITNFGQNRNIDHFKSKKNGGNNRTENLVLSCQRCNAQKGKMHGEDYILYRKFKSSKRYLNFLVEELYIKKKLKSIRGY